MHAPRAPRRRTFALVLFIAAMTITGALAACSDSKAAPKASDPAVTGRELVTEFLTILQNDDRAALADFLDPAFMLQRADGTGANRAEYLASPAKVSAFTIQPGLQASQDGDVLAVRWAVRVDEVVNGSSVVKGEAPRLSSFHWTDGQWKLLSHANFNLPN